MSPQGKKKQQHINRELVIGTGVIALIFPIMLMAMTFSVIGVVSGLLMLLGTAGAYASTALSMIVVYGVFLLIIGFAVRLFVNRYRLLLSRKQALQAEDKRITDMLDTTFAVGRLAERDITTGKTSWSDLNQLGEDQQHD